MTDRADLPGLPAAQARKIALRDRLLTERHRRGLPEIREAASALCAVLLAAPEVQGAATLAAYVSVGAEPGTGPLLEALRDAGRRVLLPVVLPDRDLDWAVHDGRLVPARFGLLEPAGPRLGPEVVAGADVVLAPGLAVDHHGRRLGRGAGCYDRALARVPADTFVCVLLYAEEVVAEVPAEDHDRRVTAVATPRGLSRLPAAGA